MNARQAKLLQAVAAISLLLILIGYPVFSRGQADTGYTKVATGITVTTYTDTTCPDAATCDYEVTAVDSGGNESTPATATGSTTIDFVAARIPVSGSHTVTLSWAAGSGDAAYNVYRRIILPANPPTGLAAVVN